MSSSALAGPGRPRGAPLHAQVQAALQQHLTRISANLVLGRACARLGVPPRSVSREQLPSLIGAMEPLLRLYLSRLELHDTLRTLRALAAPPDRQAGGDAGAGVESVIEISEQEHIDAARSQALQLCREAGMGNVDSVKVATVVSELSRNIHQYAGRGTIQLVTLPPPNPGIRVVAEDQGPGIPHLDEVERGVWRSSTGMGLGLTGSRRLMSTFRVETASGEGTRIMAEKFIR